MAGGSAEAVHRLLAAGVRDRVFPGAVWAVGDAAGLQDTGAVGLLDPGEPAAPMLPGTLFDLASLTKIVAVWTAVGSCRQAGDLPLDEPLGSYWPEVAGHPLHRITARQLLAHTAGLPLRARLQECFGSEPAAIRRGVLRAALHRPPGEAVEYTDRAGLILGYLVEHLTGTPLDRLAARCCWRPLGMGRTRFGPLPPEVVAGCAPTEADPFSGRPFRGVVHDPSARLLGGVSGIAGVFSTAEDLGRFLRHLLDPAPRPGGPEYGTAWVEESFTVQTGSLDPPRGLFWQVAPRTEPAAGLWTHTGFTGTGFWVCPRLGRWAVLLTNKVFHSREVQPIAEVRDAFRTLVFG
ncbi:serine hydrolase domain-containing protein [Kitasatospora sp. LaBMicrA B282]|uniref:serine hydrolase domain-containing protein n=1 Tax=Kitasatospora sp. LaBMicrA B282 TaxID=3420949 RepID=UPI003D09FB58